MRKSFLFSIFLLVSLSSSSQTGGLNYVRNLGGSKTDMFSSNVLLRNGNLVSVGYTESDDGYSQNNHGSIDCFVVCTSPNGIVVWKKLLGGKGWDAFISDVDTTTDGNIIVGFSTNSNDGDIVKNNGEWDLAFFKFTPDGNLIWSKVYGGSGSDMLGNFKATPDGGIIASACTYSSNSGDVKGINHGINDLWVVKLDINGDIQWQKLYGGTKDETAGVQAGGTVAVASDGGYFFVSSTNSTDGDLTGLLPAGAVIGGSDMWLSHIDAAGNILWSKLIGGSAEEESGKLYTYGNSVYLGFGTKSADRDLVGNLGLYDIALFKFDTEGILQWKSQYASGAWDNLGEITGLNGDLLTITGGTYSFSFAGYPMPSADERLIVFRIDTFNGNIKWMKALGGNGRSQGTSASINNKGELFISAISSNISGDIYANLGGFDAVILSFAAGNRITGTVFVDENNNNSPDASEVKPDYIVMRNSKGSEIYSLTSTRNGDYNLDVDTGLYTVKPLLRNNPYYTATPEQFSHQFLSNNEVYNSNIALNAIPNVKDLTVVLTPLTIIRPGRVAQYLITGYNVGTTTISSGIIGFKKDQTLSFAGFSKEPAFQSGDSVSWNFDKLVPFDSVNFVVSLLVPTTTQGGTSMNYVIYITPVVGDSTPVNNTIFFRHIIVNSFDPNCKSNNMADSMPLAFVKSGEYINYTIQFQNTGTASAIDIFIKDTLSDKLLDSTMEIICASHPFTFNLKNKVATWNFSNINLPDSNANERLSHGYIQYRIKPKTTLTTGNFIDNTASIYFDYNPPVITETNRVTIFLPAVFVPFAPVITPTGKVTLCGELLLKTQPGNGYQWFKNGSAIVGATANTYIALDTGIYTATITVNNVTSNTSAATIVSVGAIDNVIIIKINNILVVERPDATLTYTWQILNEAEWFDIIPITTGASYQIVSAGDYRVKATKGLCIDFSKIQHWETPPIVMPTYLRVYPNPAGNFLMIDNLTGSNWTSLEIINLVGQKIISRVPLNNLTEIKINISVLSSDMYVLVLRNNKGNFRRVKFIKQ